MEKERKLVLDTETTGLDFNEDKIIELGIVELRDNILTQNYFHEYINPMRDISLSAQKIHGISNKYLKDKPTFNNIAQKLIDFIKDDTLIIHNANFDTNFINKELQNCGFNSLNNSIIDTINIAKQEFPGQTVNLDSLCRKLNIINTRTSYHGALLDATLLSKVYLKLTTGKQENLDLVNYNINLMNDTTEDIKYKKNFALPREHLMSLSDDDKKRHEEFLSEMKNPIWSIVK